MTLLFYCLCFIPAYSTNSVSSTSTVNKNKPTENPSIKEILLANSEPPIQTKAVKELKKKDEIQPTVNLNIPKSTLSAKTRKSGTVAVFDTTVHYSSPGSFSLLIYRMMGT